jgi:zinc/manganese transport system substrate-binding protein
LRVTWWTGRRGALPSIFAALALGLAGCGAALHDPTPTSGAGSRRVPVVAAENCWGDIAAEIGGGHVQVTSIISDPDTDPHEYETSPRDAAAVAGARLVIENGAGYDSFLTSEVHAAGRTAALLDVQTVVGATGRNVNPHFWYSPAYVQRVAVALADRLSTLDPADSPTFQANLATFERAYQPYVATVARIKARYGGEAVAYTERVPGYLIEAGGLRLGVPLSFALAVEDGTDPTPADTAAFDSALADRRVRVLLYNAQVTDARTAAIERAARAAGVPVVGVSETVPVQYSSFSAWQTAQAHELLEALGG